MTADDFETHPIGTGKRLAELEGLAFARRRECGCTTDEDAIAAYRAWLGHDLPWADLSEAYRGPWRRVAEAMRDRGPRALVVTIAGCGHAPALNVPEQLDLVQRFLAAQ